MKYESKKVKPCWLCQQKHCGLRDLIWPMRVPSCSKLLTLRERMTRMIEQLPTEPYATQGLGLPQLSPTDFNEMLEECFKPVPGQVKTLMLVVPGSVADGDEEAYAREWINRVVGIPPASTN